MKRKTWINGIVFLACLLILLASNNSLTKADSSSFEVLFLNIDEKWEREDGAVVELDDLSAINKQRIEYIGTVEMWHIGVNYSSDRGKRGLDVVRGTPSYEPLDQFIVNVVGSMYDDAR